MLTIHKVITGHAYARNGNAHNPTPRVRWEVRENGRLVDTGYRLKELVRDYPTAKIERPERS